MTRRARWAVAAIGALCARAAVLPAQRLAGTVTSAGARVPGAVVLLLDASNGVAARAVTRADGAFSIAAPAAGRYTVRVLRIGHAPTLAGPYDLAAGATATASIALSGRIQVLPEIHVSDHADCLVRPDSSAAAFQIWNEARTALLAAAITQAEPFDAEITTDETVLDRGGTRVLSDSSRTEKGSSLHPYASLPPDSLARVGYIQTDASGTTAWGPDATVLLSESFGATHCIRPELPPADTGVFRGVIGVAFEPTARRDGRADVRGVLWLDRRSAELRSLDFSYTNVSKTLEEARSGGHVEFARLPGGEWVTVRWWIRFPSIQRTVSRDPVVPGSANRTSASERVEGIKITSGNVLRVSRSGSTLWRRGRVTLPIRIVDSTTGAGIRGALVSLNGGTSARATREDGVVAFEDLVPGPGTVTVRMDALDSLGAGQTSIPIAIPEHPFDPVVVAIASPAARFIALCGEQPLAWNEGVVRGRVPAGANDGTVDLMWQEPYTRLGGGEPVIVTETRRVATGADGTFRVCGLPRDVAINVRVNANGTPMLKVARIQPGVLGAIVDFQR